VICSIPIEPFSLLSPKRGARNRLVSTGDLVRLARLPRLPSRRSGNPPMALAVSALSVAASLLLQRYH
jgi:hypothetical protein